MPTCAPAAASARAIAIPSVPVPPATSAARSLRSMSGKSNRSRAEGRARRTSARLDLPRGAADTRGSMSADVLLRDVRPMAVGGPVDVLVRGAHIAQVATGFPAPAGASVLDGGNGIL